MFRKELNVRSRSGPRRRRFKYADTSNDISSPQRVTVVEAIQNDDVNDLQTALLDMDFNDLNAIVGGASLLSHAVRKGNEAMVRTLLVAGADPFVPNEDGELPVHEAIVRNHADCLRTLLQLRSDLFKAQWSTGYETRCCWTLLGMAVVKKCYNMVPFLAKLGARLDPLGTTDWSALDLLLGDDQICMDTVLYFLRNDTTATPVIYKTGVTKQSEKDSSKVKGSLCFHFLMSFKHSPSKVTTIFSHLTDLGYNIMEDPYLQWIVRKRRQEMEAGQESTGSNDRDLLIHVLESKDAMNHYFKPWVCIFRVPFVPKVGITQAVKYFVERSAEVRKLSSLCRISVRRRLSVVHGHRALQFIVPKLPVPSVIHSFLLLQ